MPWLVINDGGSGYGVGIRVVLKNGITEEFVNLGNIKFIGQQWSSDYLQDKTEGELQIGFFNAENGGKWQRTAFFPGGSYQFVRVVLKEQVVTSAPATSNKIKRVRCSYDHLVAENKLDQHNLEIHDLAICNKCKYECAGTLMLDHHVENEH
jgi:hypothetical protein